MAHTIQWATLHVCFSAQCMQFARSPYHWGTRKRYMTSNLFIMEFRKTRTPLPAWHACFEIQTPQCGSLHYLSFLIAFSLSFTTFPVFHIPSFFLFLSLFPRVRQVLQHTFSALEFNIFIVTNLMFLLIKYPGNIIVAELHKPAVSH